MVFGDPEKIPFHCPYSPLFSQCAHIQGMLCACSDFICSSSTPCASLRGVPKEGSVEGAAQMGCGVISKELRVWLGPEKMTINKAGRIILPTHDSLLTTQGGPAHLTGQDFRCRWCQVRGGCRSLGLGCPAPDHLEPRSAESPLIQGFSPPRWLLLIMSLAILG